MKKTFCIILPFLSLCVMSCLGQQRTSAQEERMKANCLTYIDRRINDYADSLNFWIEDMVLPKFLFDLKFDQRHFFGNECIKDRNTFSHRKAIIDRVVNVDVLKAIANSNDSRLDSLYILTPEQAANEKYYFVDFAYSTHSTRYMAERRLRRVNEIKNKLVK